MAGGGWTTDVEGNLVNLSHVVTIEIVTSMGEKPDETYAVIARPHAPIGWVALARGTREGCRTYLLDLAKDLDHE